VFISNRQIVTFTQAEDWLLRSLIYVAFDRLFVSMRTFMRYAPVLGLLSTKSVAHMRYPEVHKLLVWLKLRQVREFETSIGV
jgi:hypothetical protein